MERIKIFIFDSKGELIDKDFAEPSSKGGWIIRGRNFKLIEREFFPVEGVEKYDAIVIKEIIDKKGQKVPVLRLFPHVCRGKCEESCIVCGARIFHEYEVSETGPAERYCVLRVKKCKRCGEEKIEEYEHDFILKQKGENLICEECGYERPVKDEKEIKEYAIPPFPLEEILKLYNLSMREISELDEKIKKLHQRVMKPFLRMVTLLPEKLERSHDLWKGVRLGKYRAFLESRIKIPCEFHDYDDVWVEGNKVYIRVSNDMTILGEIIGTFYKSYILKEFSSEEELLNVLDIYSEKETKELYNKYLQEYYRLEEEYKAENEKFEEEIKNDETYKKLRKFLMSKYGEKLCYAVDPYNGYFGGSAIPM